MSEARRREEKLNERNTYWMRGEAVILPLMFLLSYYERSNFSIRGEEKEEMRRAK